MDISKDHRKLLVQEINYARKRMRETKSLGRKLYYYSAIYGIIGRVMRLDYDRRLVFAHFVLNNTYNLMNAQIQGIKAEAIPIDLREDFFEKLDEGLKSLGTHISKAQDDEILHDLEYIVWLAWTLTGAGFYESEKLGLWGE
jgi:hypothetical protein